jgi:hypothetical protein
MIRLISVFVAGGLLLSSATAEAQTFGDVINKTKKTLGTAAATNANTQTGSFTNAEATNALKQALQIGTENAANRLSGVNGYFGNQLIKILMPPEAQKVESTLRRIGMGAEVDKAILSMNRAAEDAATKAVPIFVNAITSMSIQDGISIVRGGQGAATNYLKSRTSQALTAEFKPVINNSLNKVNATRYWENIFTVYNRLPTTTSKVNTDLAAYVTERALNGLFLTIADEENKIRLNPASRVTDLLKKVFGGA